jgi:hypothetical protein
MKTCTVDGCERPAHTRMLCKAHYWRSLQGKSLAQPVRAYTHYRPQTCTVNGCSLPHRAYGYCNIHYLRWKKHGDPMMVMVGGRTPDMPPTPHDKLTYDGWNRNTTPMSPLSATHYITADQIKIQNERDGIQRDPAMRAWLFYGAPWALDDTAVAAD